MVLQDYLGWIHAKFLDDLCDLRIYLILETSHATAVYRQLCSAAVLVFRIAVFLENFLPETAGEVRSMEVCNARYLEAGKKQWKDIESVYVSCRDGLPRYEGSYNFGVNGNRLWMITSGCGGDWFYNERGKKGTLFHFESL